MPQSATNRGSNKFFDMIYPKSCKNINDFNLNLKGQINSPISQLKSTNIKVNDKKQPQDKNQDMFHQILQKQLDQKKKNSQNPTPFQSQQLQKNIKNLVNKNNQVSNFNQKQAPFSSREYNNNGSSNNSKTNNNNSINQGQKKNPLYLGNISLQKNLFSEQQIKKPTYKNNNNNSIKDQQKSNKNISVYNSINNSPGKEYHFFNNSNNINNNNNYNNSKKNSIDANSAINNILEQQKQPQPIQNNNVINLAGLNANNIQNNKCHIESE
ncbi:hypothetical protein PPERSA_01264 [Pseudocohnilembus persalinus]|uniref:Uncharacterized protein n=1 Tax=Pseudocohnilembus persalinus TaxID=266149 RepID=A0A0V0QGF4_PSEPJ|nr:hypothetical protein PPERSA_01264 [Pseudocohnilembus persalinus]|eukprot:KRX01361.1 hypothetical protein PPERSA_01264 [Pseudocohnilembus persalinus]